MRFKLIVCLGMLGFAWSGAATKEETRKAAQSFKEFRETLKKSEETVVVPSQRSLRYSTNGVLFIIDYEKKQDSAGILATALVQGAAPIITTKSVFEGVFEFYQNLDFKKNKWIRKNVGKYFCLLIPYDYLAGLPKPAKKIGSYSSDALAFGLKIDTLSEYSNDSTEPSSDTLSDDFKKNVSKLFITNNEYYTLGASAWIPRFVFLLWGHGLPDKESVVGLKFDIAREFLLFIGEKLTTELVIMLSCFAGGTQLEDLLKQSNSGLSGASGLGVLPYTLLSGAVVSAPIEYLATRSDLTGFAYDYKKFFEYVREPKPIDVRKALSYVYTGVGSGRDDLKLSPITSYANIPVMKKKGQEWISVFDFGRLGRNTASIGLNMRRTKPLDVSIFFAGSILDSAGKKITREKVYPEVLFVYPDYIDFAVKLSAKDKETKPPYIIPMTESKYTYFEEIDASDFSFLDFIKSFFGIQGFVGTKIFIIEKLKIKMIENDELGTKDGQEVMLKNVVVFRYVPPIFEQKVMGVEESRAVDFRYNGQDYVMDRTGQIKEDEQKMGKKTLQEYQKEKKMPKKDFSALENVLARHGQKMERENLQKLADALHALALG